MSLINAIKFICYICAAYTAAMQNIDLHSLRVLDEIHKTGSLSRTADRLGLSQPAISIALAKLRKHFDDQLFVRVGNEMRATPQTEGMIEGLRASISALEATLNYRLSFDPKTTERSFRIAMTDIGQIVMLPKILEMLGTIAPHAILEISNITERTPTLLESGELDLAVGFVPYMPAGFFQQALFQECFVCLSRSAHPRIKCPPTIAQYRNESHIIVTTSGTGHLVVDKALEENHIIRRIAVRIPNFLGLSTLIGTSDFIATLPRRAGLIMAENQNVKAWPTPFALPDYAVKQHWHERQNRDPGIKWLREVMRKMFTEN